MLLVLVQTFLEPVVVLRRDQQEAQVPGSCWRAVRDGGLGPGAL